MVDVCGYLFLFFFLSSAPQDTEERKWIKQILSGMGYDVPDEDDIGAAVLPLSFEHMLMLSC